MNKLKLYEQKSLEFEKAESEWEEKAQFACRQKPLKNLKVLPNMPGMTEETARGLKWKCLKWIVAKDEGFSILRNFLKRPFKYGYRLVSSMLKGKPYVRDGDFFLYGVKTIESFCKLLEDPDSLFVIGFSYCHKPFECPSGRFTDKCVNDPESLVCQQCFIGKAVHLAPKQKAITLFIPTIHYIGNKIFEIVQENPAKKVLFLITACEMTLEMFGDLGNMVGIQGVGVRLDGRICNTMKAFELSEEGIKPGLTVVLDDTKEKILQIIKKRSIS